MINCWFKRSAVLYETLHDFREVQGTDTDNLEAKLDHNLSWPIHKPLFQVFLDVHKTYGLPDRGLCLEILM